MNRIVGSLVALALSSCVVPGPTPDLARASIVQNADEVWVDVPHLANLRDVKARATAGGVDTAGRVQAASSAIHFIGLAPGTYTLTLQGKAADAREVLLKRSMPIEPYARLNLLDAKLFGLAPPRTPVPVLFAVPGWPAPTPERKASVQRSRVELTKAVRECLESLIGPALELASEEALTALENHQGAPSRAPDASVASTPLAARLLLVIDLRWPGTDDLPCQLVVSAFAVGSRDDRLWNCRRLLFQDFVELPDHQLRADTNQSDVLVRALMPAFDAVRQWPAVESLLARESTVLSRDKLTESELTEFLFPAQAVVTRPAQPATPAPEVPPPNKAAESVEPGSSTEGTAPAPVPLPGGNR